MRLYRALGLTNSGATLEEVKRAYRRCSLIHHPDRNLNQPGAAKQFQDIAEAYAILSDQEKRAVYDSYGEQGLRMYESLRIFTQTDGAEESGIKKPRMPLSRILTFLCSVASLIILLGTLFALLLFLRLEGKRDIPYLLVCAPLWLSFAAILIALLSVMYHFQAERSRMTGVLVQTIVHFVSLLALSIIVDGRIHMPCRVTLLPAAFFAFMSLLNALQRLLSTELEQQPVGKMGLAARRAFKLVGFPGVRFLFTVLLALRLDGVIDCGWVVVLSPLWLLLLTQCLFTSTQSHSPNSMHMRRATVQLIGSLVASIFTIGIGLRLDGIWSSWLWLFAPIFFGAFMYFCCCFCVFAALTLRPKPVWEDSSPRDDGSSDSRCSSRSDDYSTFRLTGSSERGDRAPLLRM